PEHGVPGAEQLLEMDVADVTRIVVPRDDDEVRTVDPVEVSLRLRVFLLEPEGRQIARADDDVGLELVDLPDGAIQQIWQEIGPAAVKIGQVRDREGRFAGPHMRAVYGIRACC